MILTVTEKLHEIMDAVLAFDIEKHLVRTEQLGSEHDFSSARRKFGETQTIFRQVRELTKDFYPDVHLQLWLGDAEGIQKAFDEIKRYSPSSTHRLRKSHEQLLLEFETAYSGCLQHFVPAIALDTIRRLDVDAVRRWRKQIADSERSAEEISKELKSIREEALSVVAAIRGAISEKGAWLHAGNFQKEAESHNSSRRWWLAGGSVLGLGVVATAIFRILSVPVDPQATLASTLQTNTPWLMLFALLSFGLVWCGRGYRGASHNWIVSSHRANALATFREFSEGAAGTQTKDAVLLHAAHCVFSHQPSGFGDQKRDPGAGYAPLGPLAMTKEQD